MKKQFMCLLIGGLSIGRLFAQESTPDSVTWVRQQKELKDALADMDGQLAARQQAFLDAQNKKTAYDTLGLGQYRHEMAVLKEQRKKQELIFIQQHPDYFSSLDALKDAIGPIPDDIEKYNNLFDGLSEQVRQSEEGKKVRRTIDRYMAIRIGAQAPFFTAPDTLGKEVKLSDFKGKYVLLDFWASWCVPCREENPMVVKAYQAFKDKNFDILSVSLDSPGQHDAWLKAIHADGLTWQHVSDLKFWKNEVAQLYAVRSIPQNFLIDPQGKIIAANLRGENLMDTLTQLLTH